MRYRPVVLCALVAACATPSDDAADTNAPDAAAVGAADSAAIPPASTKIQLRTNASQYAPGSALTLTLVNTTDATYAFNPCTRMLHREAAGGWAVVAEPQRMCTMEAWLLEPRATRSGDTELPSGIEPGRYRVAVSLSLQGEVPASGHELAVSEPFSVAR